MIVELLKRFVKIFKNLLLESLLEILHTLGNCLKSTVMFIILPDFLLVEQIFLSTQVKRSVIISNELACASCVTSCRPT